MSQTISGPKLDRSHITPVTTREELIYYSSTFLLTTILFNVLWGYAVGHQRLLRPEIERSTHR